jgi:hypothetical protein
MTVADKIIDFNRSLAISNSLPERIRAMNPFQGDAGTTRVMYQFYKKYYDDNRQRRLILGINPGRFGAGITGIPFTDTKRLKNKCGIEMKGKETHEPSSVFIYKVIDRYGGTAKFYNDFLFGAVSPLGFVKEGKNGRELNYNYYDDKELLSAVSDFILDSLKKQASFNIKRDFCICLGNNKNFKFLRKINEELHLFDEIVPLEHPRYIVQYKSKEMEKYVEKYISLGSAYS